MYLNDLTFFYLRCRFACVSEVLRNSRLLWVLSILLLPAKAALPCSPRMRTIGRRRLGCTPTRSAERQRIIEVEANHIAKAMAASVSNAATQVLPFRRHKSHSSLRLPIKTFLLGVQGGHSLLRKRMAPLSASPCAARGTRSSALRCRNAILHTFHRAVNNNSASFIWKESISIWKSEKNSGARCRL